MELRLKQRHHFRIGDMACHAGRPGCTVNEFMVTGRAGHAEMRLMRKGHRQHRKAAPEARRALGLRITERNTSDHQPATDKEQHRQNPLHDATFRINRNSEQANAPETR